MSMAAVWSARRRRGQIFRDTGEDGVDDLGDGVLVDDGVAAEGAQEQGSGDEVLDEVEVDARGQFAAGLGPFEHGAGAGADRPPTGRGPRPGRGRRGRRRSSAAAPWPARRRRCCGRSGSRGRGDRCGGHRRRVPPTGRCTPSRRRGRALPSRTSAGRSWPCRHRPGGDGVDREAGETLGSGHFQGGLEDGLVGPGVADGRARRTVSGWRPRQSATASRSLIGVTHLPGLGRPAMACAGRKANTTTAATTTTAAPRRRPLAKASTNPSAPPGRTRPPDHRAPAPSSGRRRATPWTAPFARRSTRRHRHVDDAGRVDAGHDAADDRRRRGRHPSAGWCR